MQDGFRQVKYMAWKSIKGTNGRGRFKRIKKGKHTFELAQKKVGNKWKRLYYYKVK